MNLRTYSLLAVTTSLALAVGCDIAPDFLYGGAIEGVPSVIHIEAEGGGPLVPAAITNTDEGRAATIYAEVGPSGDANPSGITYEFEGTGGAVCAWVDPELIFWNQAVGSGGGPSANRWRYPDNYHDDGDIDLRVGLSVYYTGTVGQEMGDFRVGYQDSLANPVEIDLVACTITADVLGPTPGPTAGRGAPEYCTIFNTQPGVRYTVAMQVFSTPPDDSRLGLGFVLADGPCGALISAVSPAGGAVGSQGYNEECVVIGEGLYPVEGQGALYYGYAAGRSWAGSEDFEQHFCDDQPMRTFCNAEAARMEEEGRTCEWNERTDDANRCFCGNPRETPSGGAF